MFPDLPRALRRARLVARLTETWFRRPGTPTRLVLDVTRRCNLRCAMCRTWEVTPTQELTPAEIRRLLSEMPRLVWLDITGGEPFLRRDVEEVFDAVVETTPRLSMLHFQTNGWFRDRVVEVAARIHERRADVDLVVTVSVDGPPEIHDRIRGRAGSFERALETFLVLRHIRGIEAYIGTTVMPANVDHLDDLGAELSARVPGFRHTDWHWNLLQVSPHFFQNGDLAGAWRPPPHLVAAQIGRRGFPRSLVDLMELVFLLNLVFVQRGEQSGVSCQALRSAAFVSPEGQLYPCHVYDRPLGDVRTGVAGRWASADVRKARDDIESLACGGCFTPCEAYPALAGAPGQTLAVTTRRALRLAWEAVQARAVAA